MLANLPIAVVILLFPLPLTYHSLTHSITIQMKSKEQKNRKKNCTSTSITHIHTHTTPSTITESSTEIPISQRVGACTNGKAHRDKMSMKIFLRSPSSTRPLTQLPSLSLSPSPAQTPPTPHLNQSTPILPIKIPPSIKVHKKKRPSHEKRESMFSPNAASK